jgi:hypothetical protein
MTHITRRILCLSLCPLLLCPAGCAHSLADTGLPDRSRTPFLVEYSLAPNANSKIGVVALTNTGARIFGSSTLNHLNSGLSGFGGTVSFPATVRVTWREGVTPGLEWTTGTVVGDYTVDVRARIPAKFFEMAKAAPNRVIKLQFRIKDEAVLFAWCVQEKSKLGGGYSDILNDGDFKNPTVFNGVVVEPRWEKK